MAFVTSRILLAQLKNQYSKYPNRYGQRSVYLLICRILGYFPAAVNLFKLNNENIKTMCDTCLALTIKTPNSSIDDVPSSLLLTFNIFHAFSGAFIDGFEKLNAGWVFVDFI